MKNRFSTIRNSASPLVVLISCFLAGTFAGCNGTTVLPPPGSDIENTPPFADPGPDQTVNVGDLVVLDGSASFDPDGDPLFFFWEQVLGPPVFLDTPTEPITTFFADEPGIYEFILTVDDGFGGFDAFNVFVEAVPF